MTDKNLDILTYKNRGYFTRVVIIMYYRNKMYWCATNEVTVLVLKLFRQPSYLLL